MTQAYLSVEHIDITLADAVTTATVNISAGDVAKCTPLVTYRMGNTDPSDRGSIHLDAVFLTGPNRIQVTRAVGQEEMTIHIVVVEWDTSVVSIQTGTWLITSTTANATISAVDLAKTWMVMPYQKATSGDSANRWLIRGMISTTTNVIFQRSATTGGNVSGHFWTIEDIDGGLWDIERIIGVTVTSTSDDFTIASVDTTKTFVVGTEEMIGGGNRVYSIGVAELFDATTVRYTRSNDFRNMELDLFVVELLQSGDSVQRGSLTLGSGTETDTATITSVDLTRAFANTPTRPASANSSLVSYQVGIFARLELTSSTVIEASAADNSSVSEVNWEVIELLEEAVVAQQSPVVVGTNF